MIIRPYKTADKNLLIEIFHLNTPQYFDPAEANDFAEYLEQYSNTYLTIELNDKIVGGTGYYVNDKDNSGRITWIFFHPGFAGNGLGKKAVEHCLAILRSNTQVEKFVVTTSQLAYKFFEKFSYILVATEKDYCGKGLDLYLMEQPVI